jgi:hypothetical protein
VIEVAAAAAVADYKQTKDGENIDGAKKRKRDDSESSGDSDED